MCDCIFVYLVKARTLGNDANGPGNHMRRTASLDTIYLKGHWPKDNFYWHTGTLQIDKATQVILNQIKS